MSDKKEYAPKLKCLVTGRTRLTNQKFLNKKIVRTEGNLQKYLDHYICRDALLLLKKGMTVDEVRALLNGTEINPIAPEIIAAAILIHGKHAN